MRYKTVWDNEINLFYVVDTHDCNKRVSLHWTSGEANKRRDGLEYVHPVLYKEAA